MSQMRDAGSLPLPSRGGRALRPILVVRFILHFLEAMQCRQRFLEAKSMPQWHRVGTHKVRTDPPLATKNIKFIFCGDMGVGLRSQVCPSQGLLLQSDPIRA